MESLFADPVELLGQGDLLGRKGVELVVADADGNIVGNVGPLGQEVEVRAVIGVAVDEVGGLLVVGEGVGLLEGGAVGLLPASAELGLAGLEDAALAELSEVVCQHFY